MLPPGNLRTWQIAGWSSLMMSSRVATKVAGRVGMVGWCGMAGFISQYTNMQSITKSIYRYIEYYHVPKPGFQTMNFQDLFFWVLTYNLYFSWLSLLLVCCILYYMYIYIYKFIISDVILVSRSPSLPAVCRSKVCCSNSFEVSEAKEIAVPALAGRVSHTSCCT